MRLVVNKIVAEFNKILGGSKRVGDSLKLEGKREFELDVKNSSTLGYKTESTLNVNHSVYNDNGERLRSVGTDGNPDVNGNGDPVFKTEEQLRVYNSQMLQDVAPINLEVDIARRLKVGDQADSPIVNVSSIVTEPQEFRVRDARLLGGKLEETLDVRRAADADSADLLNDTVQSELVVKEANQSLYMKRADGTLVPEENLFVKSTEFFRRGTKSYDVITYKNYVLTHEDAKNIIVNLATTSSLLNTTNGAKTWAQLLEILKSTTTSEVYKTTHLITDDPNNSVMTGAQVKDWIIGHAELVTKVASLTAKISDRATTFGSATTNYDIDGMKALIISSVANLSTLSKNSQLLENKTTSEIISRIRNEVLVTADITTDEASGFFGAAKVILAVRGIKVDNAKESDTLGSYSYTQIKEQVKAEGDVLSSKYIYTDPSNVNGGRKSYIDITTDISTLRTSLKGNVATEYDNLGKIEDFLIANKSAIEASLLTETNSRTTEDTAINSRIDSNITAINTEKGRIDSIVAIDNAGDPDTFKEVKIVTDAIATRVTTNENDISAVETALALSATNINTEINAIENSSGLESDGTYISPTSGILVPAKNLKDADAILAIGIIDEASARATGDLTLQSNIDVEKARVTKEIGDRTSADIVLENKIDNVAANLSTEVTDRATADTTEITARTFADTVLQNNINVVSAAIASEVTDRTSADTTEAATRASEDSALDTKITNNTDAIDAEVSARTTADTALANSITTVTNALSNEVTDRTSAISTEATTRANADSVLDTKIATNTVSIATETSSRIADVSNEAGLRAAADGVLTSLTTAVKSSLVGAINEVDAGISSKMEKAQELWFDDIVTADFNANVSTRFYVDVSAGAIIATLPASPVNFDKILFHGLDGDFEINSLTINKEVGHTIMKKDEPLIVATNEETFTLVFINNDWRIL